MPEPKLDVTDITNFMLKQCMTEFDDRQEVAKDFYTVPSLEKRVLVGNLVLEECMELMAALGLSAQRDASGRMRAVALENAPEIDIDDVIDAVCDTEFTGRGVLMAFGVPSEPHMMAVNHANHKKIVGGKLKFDAETGKYLKPEGWEPPDHKGLREAILESIKQSREKFLAAGGTPTGAVFHNFCTSEMLDLAHTHLDKLAQLLKEANEEPTKKATESK